MASWADFAAEAPALAEAVDGRLRAYLHHVLGTVRRDGSPRLSGTEVHRFGDHLVLGMMPGSRKGHDLRRDPRWALHTPPVDTELADGDARLAGRAVELDAEATSAFFATLDPTPPGGGDVFRLELTEVSLVRVVGEELVIDSWRSGEGVRQQRRT